MICPKCGMEIPDNSSVCTLCGESIPVEQENITEADNTPEIAQKREHASGINVGIYKLLCICMALCLVAGSVVWAVIMLRDRIDSSSSSSEAVAVAVQDETEAESTATTTTTTATTTTTTVTTTDPYKQTVEPDFEDDYGTMYTTSDSLAIRIGPGYDYEKLETSIPSGTALDVLAEQEDAKSGEAWCYISYEGENGWVCKSYLTDTSPTVTVVAPDELYTGSDRMWVTVIREGGIKLYSGPDESYDVITVLDEGEELREEGYNYLSVKWKYVSYGEQYGWIITYDGDWLNPTIE